MCGRFANDAETNELIEEFVAQGGDLHEWSISYSIAPTETVPIVRARASADDGGAIRRTLEPAVWDFRPSFIREPKRPNFNARIETIATNGMWKGAFAAHRCLVPMRGYYEWTGEKGDKQPWFIQAGDDRLLAAAGLCTFRKVDGEWEVSAAIVTREGVDASGEVHDRMPAFLTRGAWDRWLDPAKLGSEAEKQAVLDLLHDESVQVAATMRAHEVDRRVNSSRAADPSDASLIAPIG
jgi:putative SOS response-associated peptidase YedK